MTYFEMVYVTFPVTCAILADIDVLLPGAKGLLFCLFRFFLSQCPVLVKQMVGWQWYFEY